MDAITLKTRISNLSGIGRRYAKPLEHIGIITVRDLLFHLPSRYEDFSEIRTINDIKTGETVTLQGVVLSISSRKARNKRLTITEAVIKDDTGSIRAVWFNQPFLQRTLPKGVTVNLAGSVSVDRDGPTLSNPAYERITSMNTGGRHTGRLVPIYPETKGITSRLLRFLIQSSSSAINEIIDPLPDNLLRRYNFPTLADAIQILHKPKSEKRAEQARVRLAFEELLLLQLIVLREKKERAQEKALALPFAEKRTKTFVERLPFNLTNAQRKVAWEIIRDLQRNTPMARLLEGDVGSGKTVVAIIASLQSIDAKTQVAFMAPTEILAIQHFQEAQRLLKFEATSTALLTSNQTSLNGRKQPRNKIIVAIKRGDVDLVIGTHAIIQKDVLFNNLSLVIVDEQHRFGVKQRAKLIRQHNEYVPHLLSMTATPIPRTLALTIYGDLDLSLIDEMPKGRKIIETRIVAPAEREDTYRFIQSEITEGHQAFVICPLIEDSEVLEARSVETEYKKLEKIFSKCSIAMLHGQLPAKKKESIMQSFKKQEIDILIATSVVEVGIDVPNATVMMIEGSERFGLAQLHQFRGRVGRGEHQSYCFLLTDSSAKKTQARLEAILKAQNGFELAEEDLKIRGPGQFLGTKQSGLPDLAMASLKDISLIREARAEAGRLLEQDATLEKYPLLKKALSNFHERIHPE